MLFRSDVLRERVDADAGLRAQTGVSARCAGRKAKGGTSVFHILMTDSAAVSRIESSGDHASEPIGSPCSAKTLSFAKLSCSADVLSVMIVRDDGQRGDIR